MNTTVNSPRQERIDIASAALDMALNRGLGTDSEDAASFYTQLAEFDIMTNQTKYEARVNAYFLNGNPCEKDLNEPEIPCYNLNGYAAARAYAAYRNNQVLDFAVRAWEWEKSYTLLDSGVPPPFQNSNVDDAFNTRKQCENQASLAGGLMYYPRADMVASDNGRFLRLSGSLAEITQNKTYLETAQKSADFILSQLYNAQSLLRWMTSVNTGDPCQVLTDETADPWNAGYAIGGLAILSSVSGNETIKQRLESTISAATTYSAWHDSQGVMAVGSNNSGDVELLFGLYMAYVRESADSSLSSYLKSYIANQYNAVLHHATVNGTNIYGNVWVGPPPTQYSAGDQIRAVRVLVAGIGILSAAEETTPPPASSPTDPSSTTDPSSPTDPSRPTDPNSRKSLPVGGIVGGVLGGVILIALVGASAFIIRRRRLSRSEEPVSPFHGHLENQEQTRITPTRDIITGRSGKSRAPRNGSTRGSHLIPSQSTSAPPRSISAPSQSSRNEITTEELVQMLTQRLQLERWHESEAPPSYATGAR